MSGQTCNCDRCGGKCRIGKRNPDARMLRRSATPSGLCVNCATHDWLRNTYPCNMLLDQSGPHVLLQQAIREQFATMLQEANSDARIDEINWNLIVENWELPWRHKVQRSATNPYNPERDAPAEKARREELARRTNDLEYRQRKEAIEALPMTLTRFEQLNVIEPGLGDNLRNCLARISGGDVEVIPLPPAQPHYETYTPGRFTGCRFCEGRGCAACDGEFRRTKKKAAADASGTGGKEQL